MILFHSFCDCRFRSDCIACIWKLMKWYAITFSNFFPFLEMTNDTRTRDRKYTLLSLTEDMIQTMKLSWTEKSDTSCMIARETKWEGSSELVMQYRSNVSIDAVHTTLVSFPDIPSKKYFTLGMSLRISNSNAMLHKNTGHRMDDADSIFARKCERCVRHNKKIPSNHAYADCSGSVGQTVPPDF